jgi:hypothetical protein
MGSALAVAVDPLDRGHLLLGTDSGFLGSRNGGRDWELLAPDLLVGAVLAVAVDATGRTFLAASASTLAASEDATAWRSRLMPVGASPPRALVPDTGPASFYLLGWDGLFHTDDAGATWSSSSAGLPGPVMHLLITPGGYGGLLAIAGGDVWSSGDGGRTWEERSGNLPRGQLEALAIDADSPNHVWAGGANRTFESDNSGRTWTAVGRQLPDAGVRIHGIMPRLGGDTNRLIVSTDRGLYLTRDAGATWDLLQDNLPAHIQAGPLEQDGRRPTTLYAGFSVTPYEEVWQNAALGSSALARLGGSELAGAAAFLLLLVLGAGAALRSLALRSRVAGISRGHAG